MPSRSIAIALLALVVLVAATGCSGDDGDLDEAGSTTSTPATAPPTGRLDGLLGTAPVADVPAALHDRLLATDPTIDFDMSSAVRPYDAVVIAALATEVARSDAPSRIAAQVLTVTGSGKNCAAFSACLLYSNAINDFDYDGASGDIDLLSDGQSGDATFGVYRFDAKDRLAKVSSEAAEVPPPTVTLPTPDPQAGPRADGVLQVGMVFPSSGPSAPLAAAARAGVKVAVAEINAAGGVLGRPVKLLDGNSADGSDAAVATAAASVLGDGADVVIGGIGPTDTAALVGPVTAAGVVLISPGSAGTLRSPGATSGLLFRISPPVSVQGTVLAAAAAADGVTQATIIHTNDDDGNAIAATFRTGFTGLDGTVVADIGFDPTEPISTVLDRATAAPTGAFILVGDGQTEGLFLAAMRARELGPKQAATYVANINSTLLLTSA